MPNRKERRKGITPIRLHSKAFEKSSLAETVLDDGSIRFDIEWFASTVDKDYDGDIINPEWIITDRYMKNPILKNQHGRGLGTNIGLTDELTVVAWEGIYIKAQVILSPNIEDHKAIIHWLRHGLINWFSIGFGKARYEMVDWEKHIVSLELHEISLVDIPNNPSTVRKMLEIAKEVATDGEDLSIIDDNDSQLDDSDEEDSEDEDDKDIEDEDDPIIGAGEDIVDEPIADGSDNDGDGSKRDTGVEAVKWIILNSWELPVIGWMYRIKFTEEMSWWDDVYQYDEIFNCECIKIAEEIQEDWSVEYEIYWLIYTMEFDGWEATTYVVKTDLSETQIMELTEDQLKASGAIKNKEVSETTEDIVDSQDDVIADEPTGDDVIEDEVIETDPEVVDDQPSGEIIDDTDAWQDDDGLWNGTEDSPDWNDVVDPNASHEDVKEIKTLESVQKELNEAKELLTIKDARIAELESQKELDDQLAMKSAEAIEWLLDSNAKLNEFVERAKNNYREVGKMYDGSEPETPQSGLAKRLIYASS